MSATGDIPPGATPMRIFSTVLTMAPLFSMIKSMKPDMLSPLVRSWTSE